MDISLPEARSLKFALRQALSRSELSLQYQPLIDLQAARVTGFEALLRWQHPQRGQVSPAEFIPIAEQTGLILKIGEWVLQEACLCAANWPVDVSLAVNLSPVQFYDKGLIEAVSHALRISGLSPRRLQLEITESILLQDSMLILEVLATLRDLGIRIAMDDFGIGYSSLSYLCRFPFDIIKIDRSFISDIPENKRTTSIVQAVVAMCQTIGVSTTAEGIENEQQTEALRAMGCGEGQGFFFGKAVSAADIPDVLLRFSSAAGRH